MDVLGQEPYAMRWPFPRTAFAALVVALHRAGAERIVLDFIFFDASEAAEQDNLLAGVAAAIPSVILARTKDQSPTFWDRRYQADYPQFFRDRRMGNVDVVPDSDGVVRRYSSDASLAAAALPPNTIPSEGLVRWYGGLEQIRAQSVPVLAAFPFIQAGLPALQRLSEAAPGGDPVALHSALQSELPLAGETADLIRGRTVFVGANVRGTFDRTGFPVGKIEPGVLLHWTAWANLQTGGFIRSVPRSVSLLLGCAIGLVLFGTGQQRTSLTVPGAAALGLTVLFIGGSYLATPYGHFFAPSTPAVASFLALLAVAADSFWREQQRKREIQGMFSSYVAPEVVDLLMRDPRAIQLRGERRVATVVFCDLAGFTSLSEKLLPHALLRTVNAYLQAVSPCMLQHGAYIDKYIGDAVMAVFGAPLALPDDASAACDAALDAQRALEKLNREFAAQGLGKLAMRIGINTGPLIVGNVGSERKKNYTVLGDTVNLASRLEAANKQFGTTILLGPATAAKIGSAFATRPLALLQVRGKHETVEVFELLGRCASLDSATASALADYCEGYRALHSGNLQGAQTSLARVRAVWPDDPATLQLLEQLAGLSALRIEDNASRRGGPQPDLV